MASTPKGDKLDARLGCIRPIRMGTRTARTPFGSGSHTFLQESNSRKNRNVVGWGTMVSSVAHPHPNITTYASATYGRGFEGTGGDLQIGSYDLVANPHAPGHMYAPEAFGWNLGLQYNFKPNIFATVQMSQTRFLPSKAVSPDEYKYGLYWVANVFWNLTPRMQVAAEIDFAKRQNFSGDHRYARRAGLMCQFSF